MPASSHCLPLSVPISWRDTCSSRDRHACTSVWPRDRASCVAVMLFCRRRARACACGRAPGKVGGGACERPARRPPALPPARPPARASHICWQMRVHATAYEQADTLDVAVGGGPVQRRVAEPVPGIQSHAVVLGQEAHDGHVPVGCGQRERRAAHAVLRAVVHVPAVAEEHGHHGAAAHGGGVVHGREPTRVPRVRLCAALEQQRHDRDVRRGARGVKQRAVVLSGPRRPAGRGGGKRRS